ncbi:MerR family transcriptional regulator [Legionella cardiaca]|uniref:MerR family transcriptional regulator n=1 Tax=Legionella cardiaca TaxID=1071983 RepID=A0ABY8AVB1_9GAMM|nr:MerR family transcriptional regulator [Legionella cardiaca]WED44096.1 MerR family transcriptional regulator [Legionella cardiaca]
MDFKNSYFPIGYISTETGVNPVTLRAWERRYGLIQPKRTVKGHRLYSADDVILIKQILFLMSKGHAVSKIKPLLHDGSGTLCHAIPIDNLESCFQRVANALENLDQKELNNELNTLYSIYPTEQFADDVYPLLINYLENEVWLGRTCISAKRIQLFDLIAIKLYQNLYQSKRKTPKKNYLVVGFLPIFGLQQVAHVHGLLIANILRAYDHQVDFLSSVETVAELFNLSRQVPSRTLIIYTTADNFTLKNMLHDIEIRNLANIAISLVPTNNSFLHSPDNRVLLPQRFSEIYGALNRLA